MNTNSILEKENTSGHNQLGANANRPVHSLTAISVMGDEVRNKKGKKMGKVKDIMLDIHLGHIEYYVIEFGGFLGIGEKLFAVPYAALVLNGKDKDFILDIEKSFLEAAPGFDTTHWPETNSHYFDVNVYWGGFMGPNTGI